MKLKIKIDDLKKNKRIEINDKIKLGYLLESISATFKKEHTMSKVWTVEQQKYLDGMWNAIKRNTNAIEVNRKEIVQVKDILVNLVKRLEDKGII